MFGGAGINPLNLLLLATLGSICCAGCSRQPQALRAAALLWLYVVRSLSPALWVHAMSTTSAPVFLHAQDARFNNTAGYLRDLVLKPLLLVLFAC